MDPTTIETMNTAASILLAEDREEDVILIQKSFQRAAISNPLFIVRDGEEGINYLSGIGRYADRNQFPLPALFLLDLKMPGTDGFDVLRWISTQPNLKSLRVVVLTSSEAIRDVELAYKVGASSFLVKPMDFSGTVDVVKETVHYWLGRNMTSGPSATNKQKTNSAKD
jgi:CheY-like chemotaxis protein